MKADEKRFPADGRGMLCGHNFPPRQCPYAKCGYREALERLEKCESKLAILSVNKTLKSIAAQHALQILENQKFEAALKSLYSHQTGPDEWGIKCVEDHNAIIAEALGYVPVEGG